MTQSLKVSRSLILTNITMGTSFRCVSKICAICPPLRGLEFVGRRAHVSIQKFPYGPICATRSLKTLEENQITDATVTYGGRSHRAPFSLKVVCGTRITVRKYNGQQNSSRTVLMPKLSFFLI